MGKEKMMVKSFDELTKKELYDVLFLRAKVFVVEQECAYLGGSGVIPWQSYPKMIDKRYMKNGRSDTPCS